MAREQRDAADRGQHDDPEVLRLLTAGRLAEANALFDQVMATTPVGISQRERSVLQVNRAILAWRLGRIPLALELAAEGWTALDVSDQRDTQAAMVMGALGYLLEGIGHRRAALDMLRQSVQIAREAGDLDVLAKALQRLGGTLNFRALDGDADDVQACFTEARELFEEGLALNAEDRVYRALLGAYGRSLAGLGELELAEEAGSRVLVLGRSADDRWSVSVGCWVLSTVRRAQGRLAEARQHGEMAVAEAERINDTSLLLRFSQDLAQTCAELGDPEGEAKSLRCSLAAAMNATATLREGLGQALEQRRLAVLAQRTATAAWEAAARDPLTALANRLGLESSAQPLLDAAVAHGTMPWLLLIDVDWFKGVNDDAGHAAGDAALREIAQLLRTECRAEDLVARWAGDEFVVLLADARSRQGAGPAVAERIRSTVDGHDWTLVLGAARRPTVSIGVATGTAVLDKLFKAADTALYQAKREGRNRVVVYPHAAGTERLAASE